MIWFSAKLQPAAPRAGTGPFTPFPRILVRAWDRTGWGSGFVVHPRVVVTAAHVITARGAEGRSWIVGEIGVDTGSATIYATDVALPREFFEPGGGTGTPVDLAALLLPHPVCAYGEQLDLLDADPAKGYEAFIRGYGSRSGPLEAQPVHARLSDGALRYLAPDLAGFSGGAVACKADGGAVASLGSHCAYRKGDDALGAPTPAHLVRSAMEALGFGFST
jgi:hypothetical protein